MTTQTNGDELERNKQREKFDVWFESEYAHLEGFIYSDVFVRIRHGFWMAWQQGMRRNQEEP